MTNTAPTAATDTVWNTTVAPAPAAANGYTAGGNTITTSSSAQTGSTLEAAIYALTVSSMHWLLPPNAV